MTLFSEASGLGVVDVHVPLESPTIFSNVQPGTLQRGSSIAGHYPCFSTSSHWEERHARGSS